VIRGKGSVKEGRIGTKDGKPLPGADEPLHAYITSDVEENVKKGVNRVIYLSIFLLRAKAAMLSARLSYRNSVRLSVTRVDQAKTVQARISKFSPSAAWKTLVSGAIKLFRKLEGGHPERGR